MKNRIIEIRACVNFSTHSAEIFINKCVDYSVQNSSRNRHIKKCKTNEEAEILAEKFTEELQNKIYEYASDLVRNLPIAEP